VALLSTASYTSNPTRGWMTTRQNPELGA
jgi:hypothetical protein